MLLKYWVPSFLSGFPRKGTRFSLNKFPFSRLGNLEFVRLPFCWRKGHLVFWMGYPVFARLLFWGAPECSIPLRNKVIQSGNWVPKQKPGTRRFGKQTDFCDYWWFWAGIQKYKNMVSLIICPCFDIRHKKRKIEKITSLSVLSWWFWDLININGL